MKMVKYFKFDKISNINKTYYKLYFYELNEWSNEDEYWNLFKENLTKYRGDDLLSEYCKNINLKDKSIRNFIIVVVDKKYEQDFDSYFESHEKNHSDVDLDCMKNMPGLIAFKE